MLAWLTRTMDAWGGIASTGLTGGIDLKLTVIPFILRGVRLIGVNSGDTPMPLRRKVWGRLAGWGCDEAQGFCLARPMPGDELSAWLAGLDRGPADPPRPWAAVRLR